MKRTFCNPTEQTIIATRQHFADMQERCIDDAEDGITAVNDLPSYIARCEEERRAFLAGEYDHTFTFRQHAHYLQTGECLGLLGDDGLAAGKVGYT